MPTQVWSFAYPAVSPISETLSAPEQKPVPEPVQEQLPEPKTDQTVDELLTLLNKNGISGGEVRELPSGAVRITVDEFVPEYVRVKS